MIKSALQSSLTNDVKYRSMAAGAVPSNEYLIETITVGATPAASVTFNLSGLGEQFRHLNLVMSIRDNRGVTSSNCLMYFNGVQGSSYSHHRLYAAGTGINGYSGASQPFMIPGVTTSTNASAGEFAPGMVEILDAFSNLKNKTIRSLSGNISDNIFVISSGAYFSTNPLTSITLYPFDSASFVQNSRFSLYGVTL